MNTTQSTTPALTPEELDMIEQADTMLANQEAFPHNHEQPEQIETKLYMDRSTLLRTCLEITVFYTGCAAAWVIVIAVRAMFGW